MSVVIDASLVLAWLLPDERSAASQQLFASFAGEVALAPAHWPLEVANALLIAERRGRIGANERAAALVDVAALDVTIDALTSRMAWASTVDLAARHGLTVYDAAYLELALRGGSRLGTLDAPLRAAATAAGALLLGD